LPGASTDCHLIKAARPIAGIIASSLKSRRS
jgi:hypothetical protein